MPLRSSTYPACWPGGPGWASGFSLYAVVFRGMMGVLGWMPLPSGPAGTPLVLLTVSGALLVVEFFADKVPWVDSAWDAAHAFIRVPAGRLSTARLAPTTLRWLWRWRGCWGLLSATALATKMTTQGGGEHPARSRFPTGGPSF